MAGKGAFLGARKGAYLGAVSWVVTATVVNNSGLGFLGGGRKHFTMPGLNGCEGNKMHNGNKNIKDRHYRWRSQRICGDSVR